ncbi:MAG: Calx-beta domain-containing protein, partial [Nevskia sp.]|nr:Calx-beta domain-containing protein [Nevskia sp.]
VLVASGVTGTSTVITGLNNDTLYYFSVAGLNAGGTGARSTEVSATPGPSIRVNDVSVTEGNSGTSNATFTVSLSAAATVPVTVAYATANGTATADSDYVAGSGTLTFAAGTTTQTVNVLVNGDTTVEPNETFAINLSAPTGATIADAQGQGSIVNDDGGPAQPSVSINDVSVTEGNTGTTTVTFTIRLSAAATADTSVRFATAPGTATAGTDYATSTGALNFTAGQTSRTRSFTINGDTAVEPNETFFVNLSSPVGLSIADAQGVATIVDDDSGPAQPSVSINDVSVTEGNTGTKTVTFTIRLSAAATADTSVRFATAPGSATAGTDYVTSSGALTFTAGQTSRTRSFTINGDTTVEPNETFFVNLSSPVGLTIADAQGVATISNDD